jgi:hypothetical protein
LLIVALLGLGGWLFHRQSQQPNFFEAFFPNLWANIIGVSIAAIIGVPTGILVNRYVHTAGERKQHQRQRTEVAGLIERVSTEVSGHSTDLQYLVGLFTKGPQTTSKSAGKLTPQALAGVVLQDVFGQQFLAAKSPLEAGESVLIFEVGNYYARVQELKGLLNLRMQDAAQPSVWDAPIENQARVLISQQAQMDFRLKKAVADKASK